MIRAAILNAVGSPLEIADDVVIDRPRSHEVLVRTAASGVCHSDLHYVKGLQPVDTPCVAGHESAGVVEAVGSDVRAVRPGDHVVTCLSAFCGSCRYCLLGQPFLCRDMRVRREPDGPSRLRRGDRPLHQFFNVSAFAEQMLVHENQVVRIDPTIPLDRAALLGCATITGVGAVLHTARVEPGSTVVVFGCGGIGLNVVAGARIAGAARVIGVDPVAAKRKLAERFGATDTVDPTGTDVVSVLLDMTDGGADHAFEAIGLPLTCEQAMGAIRRGGTVTVIGMMPAGQHMRVTTEDLVVGKRLLGSSMGSNRFVLDVPFYAALYERGQLPLDLLVSARLPLDRITDAFDELDRGELARSVIVFE
jgi:S-(hydroxymethyl)glutathione dehydrogenase/alcohol dehydrogenase